MFVPLEILILSVIIVIVGKITWSFVIFANFAVYVLKNSTLYERQKIDSFDSKILMLTKFSKSIGSRKFLLTNSFCLVHSRKSLHLKYVFIKREQSKHHYQRFVSVEICRKNQIKS